MTQTFKKAFHFGQFVLYQDFQDQPEIVCIVGRRADGVWIVQRLDHTLDDIPEEFLYKTIADLPR